MSTDTSPAPCCGLTKAQATQLEAISTTTPTKQADGEKRFGVPHKSGKELIKQADWHTIVDFINSRLWYSEKPALEADLKDELLNKEMMVQVDGKQRLRGAFMLGFDFHLTDKGPKLIEVNTNAGGLATVFNFPDTIGLQQLLRCKFAAAVREEYRLFRPEDKSTSFLVAIVDDNVKEQGMYAEMEFFAQALRDCGLEAVVVSPEDMVLDTEGNLVLKEDGRRVDFLYNRVCDFRMEEPNHKHIREAAIADKIVLSPHPALYARAADKRILATHTNGKHPVVPPTYLLSMFSLDHWRKSKKNYVFKPASGFGSRGVYRGASFPKKRIETLPPDTIVQERVNPPKSKDDDTKFDFRVYTHDTQVLGLATRHFRLQVMEMKSQGSGFKEVVPEGVCCFPMAVHPEILGLVEQIKKDSGWTVGDMDEEQQRRVTQLVADLCGCAPGGGSCRSLVEQLLSRFSDSQHPEIRLPLPLNVEM